MSSLTNGMKKIASAAQKSMQKQQLIKTITERFINLLNNFKVVYNDNNYETIITVTVMLKKTNPKLIISLWQNYVSKKYAQEIFKKNVNFILTHDIMNDFTNNNEKFFSRSTLETGENILTTLRQVIREKYNKDEDKTNVLNSLMDECVIITKLCELYSTL